MVFCLPLFFCFLIMTIERDDSLQYVSMKLDGKNYSYWSYVIRNFLKGKKRGRDMLLELVLNLKVLMRIMLLS